MEKTIRVECTGAANVELEKIIPLQGDLKTISPEKLRKLKTSIIDYGISSPTQVWVDPEGNYFTLDGHQRLLAYRSLEKDGWLIPEIPVVYVDAKDIDEAKEKLLIATSAYGEFSATGVERFIKSLKNRDRIKNNINLSNVNLHRIYAVLNSKTDPDAIPIIETKPTIAKRGDLWICGKHKIVCGDSREKSVVERFGIDSFQLCVTDPPFGISYQPEWRKKFDGSDNRKSGIVLNDDKAVFEDTFRNINSDVVYCFHASTKTYDVLHSFTQNLEYDLRAIVIWVKQNAPISMGAWHHQHEPILYLVKNGKTANWVHNDHSARTVIECANQNPFGGHFSKNSFDNLTNDPDTRTEHSTQKPVNLLTEILKHHTAETVIDPFLGSASTMIACQMLNKACMGVELNERYVDLALNRYLAFTGESPVRESDGKEFSALKKEFEYMEE
jgi:DNA modification methylase